MADNTSKRESVAKWLEYLAPSLQSVDSYKWNDSDVNHLWDMMRRSAIKRQYEAICATLMMIDNSAGHFAVTLVRPAYEELIWIEYLHKIPDLASKISALVSRKEVRDSLDAQNEYAGAKGMQQLGFSQRYIKRHVAQAREVDTHLKEIGRSLGWRDGQTLPSTAFLARKIGREREYKFLYQGTSRFVHFSGLELLRRVWGTKGKVDIGSNTFSRYWSDFALYWLFRIFLDLNIACIDVLGELDTESEKVQEMMAWLNDFAAIPIITAGELESWDRP